MKKKTIVWIWTAAILLAIAAIVMAGNEISLQTVLKASKSNAELSRAPGVLTVDWTTNNWYSQTYVLTTTKVALAKGSVGVNGYAYMRNISTGRLVSISFDGGTTEHLRLEGSEFGLLRIAPGALVTNIFVWAQTNTAVFEFTLLEK